MVIVVPRDATDDTPIWNSWYSRLTSSGSGAAASALLRRLLAIHRFIRRAQRLFRLPVRRKIRVTRGECDRRSASAVESESCPHLLQASRRIRVFFVFQRASSRTRGAIRKRSDSFSRRRSSFDTGAEWIIALGCVLMIYVTIRQELCSRTPTFSRHRAPRQGRN